MLRIVRNGEEKERLQPVPFGERAPYPEHWIRDLVFDRPDILPVAEVDFEAAPVVPICKELRLGVGARAGLVDVVYVSPHGRITLVECKLWHNPEARRRVVGQILEYAAALRATSYADFEAALRRRGVLTPNGSLHAFVAGRYPDQINARFVDRVTEGLRSGRFCLLILGDGIRSEVHAINEYLRPFSNMAFTLGLIEVEFYRGHDADYVLPRVALRTQTIEREYAGDSEAAESPADSELSATAGDAAAAERDRGFWDEFIRSLHLEHAEQPPPVHGGRNWVKLRMPKPLSWVTLFRAQDPARLGAFVRFGNPAALEIFQQLVADVRGLEKDLGEPVHVAQPSEGGQPATLTVVKAWDGLNDSSTYSAQRAWLARVANRLSVRLRKQLS